MIKAQLVEIERQSRRPRVRTRVVVQFNPETIQISYASPPDGPSTSTLRLQLWFDVGTEATTAEPDVRQLTSRVASFINRRSDGTPPLVRFAWGSFRFDGVLEALDETLEFFAADGRALRAQLSLVLRSDYIPSQAAR